MNLGSAAFMRLRLLLWLLLRNVFVFLCWGVCWALSADTDAFGRAFFFMRRLLLLFVLGVVEVWVVELVRVSVLVLFIPCINIMC